MKDTFFSIITCTKNSAKFIDRNIDTVRGQSFKDYEHIFIDAESKDGTVEVMKNIVKKDPKCKLFSVPANGISNAFNEGIKKSKGKHIFFLNSDDFFYDKNVLQDVYDFLIKNKSLDWIYGKINVVEEDGKSIGTFPNRQIFKTANKNLLKYINFIPHQGVFMKRDVFDKFGCFDESLKTSMDRDLWLRIADKTKWRFFDRIIAGYTIRKGSATSSMKAKSENAKRTIMVQKRYLRGPEVLLARLINMAISRISKIHR